MKSSKKALPEENNDATARVRAISRKNARPGVSAMRSHSRVSTDRKRERQVKVDFLDTDKIHKIKQNKGENFCASGFII